MINRRKSRKSAYRYIMGQAKKAARDLSPKSDRTIAGVNYLSLDDILRLKEGISDKSQNLVAILEKLLCHIASEAKIDDYLVTPLQLKT